MPTLFSHGRVLQRGQLRHDAISFAFIRSKEIADSQAANANRITGLVGRCGNDERGYSGGDSVEEGSDPAVVNKRETSWQHFAEGYVMKVAHCIRQRPGKLLAELREQKSTASSYAANVCSH